MNYEIMGKLLIAAYIKCCETGTKVQDYTIKGFKKAFIRITLDEKVYWMLWWNDESGSTHAVKVAEELIKEGEK